MSYFTNKTVYITGAASGIGLETAKQLINQGSNLVLFDVQPLDEVLSTLQAMNKNDASIAAYQLDVTDADMTTKQIATAAESLSPDILMHFVGITGPWTFDDMSQEQFERVVNINLFGTRNVLAACVRFYHVASKSWLPLPCHPSLAVMATALIARQSLPFGA